VTDETLRQAIADEEHLKLLSIGYLLSAGVAALFSLMGLVYVFMGVLAGTLLENAAKQTKGSPPPVFVGWIIGVVGLAIFLLLISLAILKFFTARCIKKRRSRTFCLVVAALSCLEFPYGTVLGVFTFLVLDRYSVQRLFQVAGETPRST
jgi:hypothetical protein